MKHISPGTWSAIRQYVSLPKHPSKLFLQPTVKTKSLKISIASYLRRFCQVYLPAFPPTTVNLFRKFYPSGLHNDTEKAKDYVARCEAREKAVAYSAGCDAHSTKMALDIYACSTPEEQSSRAKEMVRVLIGGPVEMPCEADILRRRSTMSSLVSPRWPVRATSTTSLAKMTT